MSDITDARCNHDVYVGRTSRIYDLMFCKFLADCVFLTVMLAGGVFTILRVKLGINC